MAWSNKLQQVKQVCKERLAWLIVSTLIQHSPGSSIPNPNTSIPNTPARRQDSRIVSIPRKTFYSCLVFLEFIQRRYSSCLLSANANTCTTGLEAAIRPGSRVELRRSQIQSLKSFPPLVKMDACTPPSILHLTSQTSLLWALDSLNGLALGSRKSQCLIERWPEPEDVWRRRRLPNGLGKSPKRRLQTIYPPFAFMLGDYTHLSHLGWYITALAHQCPLSADRFQTLNQHQCSWRRPI